MRAYGIGLLRNMHVRSAAPAVRPPLYIAPGQAAAPAPPLDDAHAAADACPAPLPMPAPPNAAYADAKRLLPLSLLPYR